MVIIKACTIAIASTALNVPMYQAFLHDFRPRFHAPHILFQYVNIILSGSVRDGSPMQKVVTINKNNCQPPTFKNK